MASRKQRRKRPPVAARAADAAASGHDPRLVDAVTVAWMLSLIACLLAEVGAVIGLAVIVAVGGADRLPGMVALIPTVLAFIAWVTGTFCLGLTLLVRRVRRDPAPALIVRTAVVAGLLPWIGLAGVWLASSAR